MTAHSCTSPLLRLPFCQSGLTTNIMTCMTMLLLLLVLLPIVHESNGDDTAITSASAECVAECDETCGGTGIRHPDIASQTSCSGKCDKCQDICRQRLPKTGQEDCYRLCTPISFGDFMSVAEMKSICQSSNVPEHHSRFL